MGIVLCFVAVRAEDYDTPLWTANRCKYFLEHVSYSEPVSLNSLVKTSHYICSAAYLLFEILPLFFWYLAVLIRGICANFQWLFPWHVLCKGIADEHSLFIRVHFSYALIAYSLLLAVHDWTSISCFSTYKMRSGLATCLCRQRSCFLVHGGATKRPFWITR